MEYNYGARYGTQEWIVGRVVEDAKCIGVSEYWDILWNNFAKDGFIPDKIVELGTGHGWFTTNNLFGHGSYVIHTFDIKDAVVDAAKRNEIMYYFMDIFEHEQDIADLLKLGCVLLVCDNGHKIREVNLFAKYLKSGDVIMVHDYCYDLETHNRLKYISGCEVTYPEIADAVKDFEPYYHDFMMEVGWGCFKRK